MKRKFPQRREREDDMKSFIVDNESNSDSDDVLLSNISYNKRSNVSKYITHKNRKNQKHKELEKKIDNAINEQNITWEDILELQLEMDDYIWFKKYICLRDSINEECEEKIKMEKMIYDKYLRLKDIDYYKMEKIKDDVSTNKSIVKRIINSEHGDYIKALLFKKYKLFCENNDSCSEEYSKCIEWIDTVLNIPTKIIEITPSNISETGNKLKKLNNFLTNRIYGLNQVKEKIMEAMCCKIINPNETNGKILCLVGPPGVGKTSVASTIAEAMNLPFEQISFGSIQDSKILTGHSSTYIGALPGLLTKILIKAKRLDSLILLDEIDKITDAPDSNITSVLFHVLDKSQNHRFKDIYIPEVPLDLSQIIFLCAANDCNKIDPILRDRMTIIELPGYTISDKVNISEIYLVPKFKRELKFEETEIIIGNKELEYLISKKTKDQPGMRDVERRLKELFDRLALLKHSKSQNIPYSFDIKNIKFPIKITPDVIDKLL